MKTSGTTSDGGRRTRAPGVNAAARARAAGEDFGKSFARLQDVVARACARHTDWEARIAAGIQASLEFAATYPSSARALTLQARRADREGRDGQAQREQQVIAYFTERLAEVAPSEKRFPICTDEAIVESIATVVRGHLQRGNTDELPEAAPDLIYFALVPYAGLEGARRWTDLFLPISALDGT